jgi:hypothetical protein
LRALMQGQDREGNMAAELAPDRFKHFWPD